MRPLVFHSAFLRLIETAPCLLRDRRWPPASTILTSSGTSLRASLPQVSCVSSGSAGLFRKFKRRQHQRAPVRHRLNRKIDGLPEFRRWNFRHVDGRCEGAKALTKVVRCGPTFALRKPQQPDRPALVSDQILLAHLFRVRRKGFRAMPRCSASEQEPAESSNRKILPYAGMIPRNLFSITASSKAR